MQTNASPPLDTDEAERISLGRFGYRQQLNRVMGTYSSFALSFALISITVTVFTLFTFPLQELGGVAVWMWIPVTLGGLLLATIWGHMAVRLPITGYAYSWISRVVNPYYGWFVGWAEILGWVVGTIAVSTSVASVFAPFFWTAPTHADIDILSGIAILLAAIVNLISIRLTAIVNNIGASVELIGTIGFGVAMAIALPFLHHIQGPSILVHVGTGGSAPVTLTAIIFAALLPIYTIAGWDGAADLAEETHKPRRSIPRAMQLSVLAGGISGFFLFAVYSIAIPGSVSKFIGVSYIGGTSNPILSIVRTHFGSFAEYVLIVIAGWAMFSALLALVAASGRVVYAIGRDNMLPASVLWSKVAKRTRTPFVALIVIALLDEGANVLGGGFVTKVVAIGAVAVYAVYILLLAGILFAHFKGRIPAGEEGALDLGRWLLPAVVLGLAWSILIILMESLPAANQEGAIWMLYGFAIGAVWFVAVLYQRIRAGRAGPGVARFGREELGKVEALESVSAPDVPAVAGTE
jgi:amino acid transporter